MKTPEELYRGIPNFLKKQDFRFVKVKAGTKIACESDWQNTANYAHDDPELVDWINQGNNYGVLCGYGDLLVIDFDDMEFYEKTKDSLPPTFQVKTGSGKVHLYYLCKGADFNYKNMDGDGHLGEVRANNCYVVGAGSVHPDTQERYEVQVNVPIAELDIGRVNFLFEQTSEKATKNDTETKDETRSAVEYRHVCKLVRQNKTKNDIFREMLVFDKWKHSTPQYKEKTYDKACEFINNSIDVVSLLAQGRRDDATEMMVENIMGSEHIYTIRSDREPQMWVYREGIYVAEGKTVIQEACGEMCGKALTSHLVNNVILKIQTRTFISEKDFFKEQDINMVCLENGIFDLKRKKLKEFNPKMFFFNKLPITYKARGVCPNIMEFLKSTLRNEDLPVIQELFGYSLLREYKIEKAIMFLGDGRNGKSKVLELLKRFLGADNVSNISLTDLENNDFIKAELFKKLLNVCADLSPSALKNTGAFKALTGRDQVTANRKFLQPLSFTNYAKMCFATNQLPMTYDLTLAFFNRWVLLEFPYTFLPQKEYNLLDDKTNVKVGDKSIIDRICLPEEISGLFNWAIEGLDRLMKQGDFSYSKSTDEVKSAWQRKSSSINAFLMDCIEYDYDSWITKDTFSNEYVKFCREHKLKIENDKRIKSALGLYGAFDGRVSEEEGRFHVWKGIKIKERAGQGGQADHGFSPYRKISDSAIGSNTLASLTTLTNFDEEPDNVIEDLEEDGDV